ncbi:MAG: isoleucine--tRNA ligase [Chloroflexi bacterium]|nr:isoleucine--tRNA ligase [Chloroflexota bacterium]
MFKAVTPKLNQIALEEAQLRFWKENEIFKKSSEERKDRKPFVMFEGPPTANGKPGIHHVIGRVYKDMFPRYKTMQGYYVDRRGGWDTHGLPVEVDVEKRLGFTHKSQVEEFGIAKFNELCKESAFTRIQDWTKMTERIAYWVDFERAYVTYEDTYMESVWWLLRQIWDKNLLYQGFKVVPYCPRCGTPLSDHEVALGYQDTEDPSVYVRFPLVDEPNTYLLVWTTTPWTLPANVAIAAHPDVEYVMVTREDGLNDERLILAKDLVETVFGETRMKVLKSFKGKSLKGRKYAPLFTFLPPNKPAYFVVTADYVTTTDGTGLVHTAPAFGADDMTTATAQDLPLIMTINDEGNFKPEVKNWAGQFVKEADPKIIEDLRQRGLLFASGKITHTYPFCWRCDTPLLYYARPSWFIRTSAVKDRMVALNQEINWLPDHIKNGRFGNWLENNIDWALGRNRYWGTPLPVWICPDCGYQHCVGSRAELGELTGTDHTHTDLHRPFVDEITFECPKCHKAQMHRVPELIDVWFDSGAMPAAQWHYPFENRDEFKQQFPADFICEAIDQTRGWFYSLLAVSTLVFDAKCYDNVICYGHILDGEGKKMSKSRGNIVDPWDVINAHGVDAIRWYMCTATPPGNSRNFSKELVGEVVRNFTLPLWNTYSFFVTYANLDKWTPDNVDIPQFSSLDYWLLSSLNVLVRDVTQAYENYDVIGATRPIEQFVDQLSNWYLRRSRRRFWKSESDADKAGAYETLYRALTTLAKLLAPSMPFLAEEMYQNLNRSFDDQAPLSVHLDEWPKTDESLINAELNHQMEVVMKLASLGHAARNKSNIKVRQPLSEIAFAVGSADEVEVVDKYADILLDELNVKSVRVMDGSSEAVTYRINPLPRQLGQKYKGEFPKIREAILALPVEATAQKLLEGLGVVVEVDGKYFEILPDEVEVHTESKAGYVVASEGKYLAALVTDLTPALVNEGLAREVVRRVQDLRKSAGLDIADRIQLRYAASEKLARAIQAFSDYIAAETLAVEVAEGDVPENWALVVDQFDGETLTISLTKNEEQS